LNQIAQQCLTSEQFENQNKVWYCFGDFFMKLPKETSKTILEQENAQLQTLISPQQSQNP